LPDNLSYLPGFDGIRRDSRLPADLDTIVTVDSSDLSRLGAVFDDNSSVFDAVAVLNIDHHTTSKCFGHANLVDAGAAATGEQVYDLLLTLGVTIDPIIATCLLTALVTDTRVFRTASTTPRTLAISSKLFEAGAPLSPIVEMVYRNRPLTTLRLWGLALQRLKWDSGIAWTSVTREMQEKVGASPSEGDGVVDLISSLRDVKAVALFRETDEGIKVSLRAADGVDVSEVATFFGGGGHPRASGCLLPGDLEGVQRAVVNYLIKRATSE
jgi:phosphoesterase RecJ-like protein